MTNKRAGLIKLMRHYVSEKNREDSVVILVNFNKTGFATDPARFIIKEKQ